MCVSGFSAEKIGKVGRLSINILFYTNISYVFWVLSHIFAHFSPYLFIFCSYCIIKCNFVQMVLVT